MQILLDTSGITYLVVKLSVLLLALGMWWWVIRTFQPTFRR